MKKSLVGLFVIALCFIIVGCSSESSRFEGIWEGEHTQGEMKVIFSEGDTVTMSLGDLGLSGNYIIDGEIATIALDNGNDATFTLTSDTEAIFIAGGESITLTKQIEEN